MRSYNKYNDSKLNKGLFKKVNKAVKNIKHTTLKQFFTTIGAVTKASRLNNSIIQQIYYLYMLKDLAKAYIKFIAKISTKKLTIIGKEKKKRLLKELKSQGYSTNIR